jgi:glycosyltransferase involved in cell wall biosynthesis
MTRVAMLTPLPPARTGVAHYAAMLIPALRAAGVDVEAIGSPRPRFADRLPSGEGGPVLRIYHLGNNPHHDWIYREAMTTPGVIVLHDLVLHHLIVEMTLARGDAAGYAAALRASHGAAGEAWAWGRAAGLHSEMGNFLLPASVEVARRSRAVIVHNAYAARRLRSFGVTTPIHVVPHPYEPQPGPHRDVRAQHGFGAGDRVIGLFGFLTSAKRAEVVLAAFARARAKDRRLQLLVVGEPAPDVDVEAFRADGVTFTGYVDDRDFAAYFAAVDRLVNLRYPSAGETSGTLIRAFEAGKPVAVSDYAQFAELPDDCVVKIPFGETEVDTLADFFLRDLTDPSEAQRNWLEENASMEKTVQGYKAAIQQHAGRRTQDAGLSTQDSALSTQHSALVTPTIPLFPTLTAHVTGATVELRNAGDTTLRTRDYAQPGYHLVMQVIDEGRVVVDRWVQLPRDLAPGETATIDLPAARGTLRLFHALQDVPEPDPRPFAVLELAHAAV